MANVILGQSKRSVVGFLEHIGRREVYCWFVLQREELLLINKLGVTIDRRLCIAMPCCVI